MVPKRTAVLSVTAVFWDNGDYMAATIIDIKEKTGLSLATISKYLNGGNVLPENKEKIEAAIKELHYEVNEIARGLVTNKTRTIGVVVFSIESLFNGILLHHIGEALRKQGYGLLICDSANNEKSEEDNIRFLLSKKVDGLIVIPVSCRADFLKPVLQKEIPMIMVDRHVEGLQCDCISINNREAAKQAVDKLIENNHRQIAVIYSAKEYTGIERYQGFMDAMDEAGLTLSEEYRKAGVHSLEHGYESMKALLELANRPTAVFMSNYEITLGAAIALKESVYRCPEDISMLGFDNLMLSGLVEPKISVVVQPMQEIGEKAAELLLKRIQGKMDPNPVELVLETTLQEGDSHVCRRNDYV